MFSINQNSQNNRILSSIDLLNQKIQDSIYRLSSGNRIVKASDDIGAVTIGSNLIKEITTLNTNLSEIGYGNSIVNIASDSVNQISDIVNQMTSLALQASSSSYSDTERANLNITFQQYIEEINSIANNTTFNGKKLLNGNLSTAALIKTDTTNLGSTTTAKLLISTSLTNSQTIAIQVGSDTVTFTAKNASFIPSKALLEIDISVHATTIQQAMAMVDQITQINSYAGDDADVLNAKKVLAKLNFTSNNANEITIETVNAGNSGSNPNIAVSAGGTVNLDGSSITGSNVNFGGSTPITSPPLSSGSFVSGGSAYGGTATTIASGKIGDSILLSLTQTTQATTGVDASHISNNPNFVGKIQGFEASFNSDNYVNLTLTVGSYTYKANNVKTNNIANTIVTMASTTIGGGYFTMQFDGGEGTSVTDQSTADVFAERLDRAFSTVSFYQKRDISSYIPSGIIYNNTTVRGDLSGSKFQLISDKFNEKILINDIKVSYNDSGNALIEFTINNEIYRSGYYHTGALNPNPSNIISNSSGINNDGKLGFVNVSNGSKVLILEYESAQSLTISSKEDAAAVERAFKNAFGVGLDNQSLTINTGNSVDNQISITIPSMKTSDILVNSSNESQTLTLDSQENANNAIDILSNAMKIITQAKTKLGASSSRLSFAYNSADSAIFNISSLKSDLLDTNVMQETENLASLSILSSSALSALSQSIAMQRSVLKLLDRF